MANFLSKDISIYPSSKRSDLFDRNSKLNSEQNLISIVNRMTNLQSFIIDGLTITEDGFSLLQGSCNIGGYLFNIHFESGVTDAYSLAGLTGASNNDFLCLSINVVKAERDSITFSELQGHDSYSGTDINSISYSTSIYDGLTLSVKQSTVADVSDRNLPIARWSTVDNKWVSLKTSTLKSLLKDIKVDISGVDYPNYPQTVYGAQDFESWIMTNYVIDDGELK